jgi:PPOX class probable F420-dependent enzyme
VPLALPQSVKDLLEDRAYGHVVTRNADGSPQLTMVWLGVEGDEVLIVTARDRQKDRNLRRDPRIIISVQNRNQPQSYLLIHGTATVHEEGPDETFGYDVIDGLGKRFGIDPHVHRAPGEVRVLLRITADRIDGFGPDMTPWH